LAKNALKAMPDGGTLRVSAESTPAGGARVTFEDDGVGMTKEEMDAAFQPFRGSFDGGTGLGLAVVFRVVQEHGGRIRVQSRPGEGARFTIELESAAQPRARADARGAASAAGSR